MKKIKKSHRHRIALCFSLFFLQAANAEPIYNDDRKQCMDVEGGAIQNGTSVITYNCHGGKNQNFKYESEKIFLADNNNYCVDVSRNPGFKPDRLIVWECNGGNNQKFLYENGQFKPRDRESQCLTHTYNGEMASKACNGAKDQQFNFTKSTFIITSDPQLTCGSNCGLTNQESKDNVTEQYKLLSLSYPNASAVIINGDITEYGHGGEWGDFESAAKNLSIPYYYGLGNHDMYNNLNDCWENNCTIRSLMNLYHHVKSKKNIISFDALYSWGYDFPQIRETLEGSLSYSVDFGNAVLIQLNDYERNKNPIFIDQYSSGGAGNGAVRYIINRNQDNDYVWLQNQLHDAYVKKKVVIFNQHRPNADAGNLNKLLDMYGVKLRFAGHYHDSLGEITAEKFILSGSTARGTYIKLDIDYQNQKADVFSYDKYDKYNPGNLTLVKTIDLKPPVNDPVQPTTPELSVRVKNEGGYDSHVYIDYDLDGKRHNITSHKLSWGNVYTTKVPRNSKNVTVRSVNNTGVVWDPQRTIFHVNDVKQNFCANTWGTTLSPAWGYVSCN